MIVKVKYENGVLRPLEKVELKDKEIYEIEVKKVEKIKGIKAKDLKGLVGIVSIGGNAVEDSEKIYDE
jgi:predicted DNA-binding antitoxin AbrB/MazE fold protein